uniref:Uncharacterized protein n=1 Tax=Romanomermis culicivorax TaxID=13658 RepID=A0A915HSA3_ROMCU
MKAQSLRYFVFDTYNFDTECEKSHLEKILAIEHDVHFLEMDPASNGALQPPPLTAPWSH